ncbi:hypothetical protein [Anaerotignum propionicum]|uniref:Uncharacterized protein n=1 Tax=Anaerotignum propionicum DSM 1682 TaxID=991789 RepID=A0A0X1U7U5_ANAPI|nr:hypothetical protein [Anaerotignum propionicum]AMJ41004.1 hypothetical protein CPRO_14110 [Anaerotignum propionicum DSM 1682]SHE61079.1 hypothetical protein SAMN02745151_01222 [[Clostridium] propionicum DSM 1682] [Anaerotignum propionicum DSM 1682]
MNENETNKAQGKLQQGSAILRESTKVTIQNLMTVKSIVTILLTAVFSYLAIVGRISGEQFLTIFSVVIAFYFGTQYQKNSGGEE